MRVRIHRPPACLPACLPTLSKRDAKRSSTQSKQTIHVPRGREAVVQVTEMAERRTERAQLGGRDAVSTTSSASFSSTASECSGERGNAMSPRHHKSLAVSPRQHSIDRSNDIPVRALSRIPNGAINFIKLSILTGFALTSTIQLFVLISKIFPPN